MNNLLKKYFSKYPDKRNNCYIYSLHNTSESWNNYFDEINPNRIVRGPEMHLDHIYSKLDGYENNIDPKIIGHHSNLRLITRRENSLKSRRSDKTIEQLIEDYS